MKSARIIYHLARADFLERVRRYSFLVMLGLVVFLGYQAAIGNMTLTLGQYRGEFNSAWVGAMMSLNATLFIGWFGFYLVKGSVARDRETGVGQIMATTPLTRSRYMLGKALSNFAILFSMVVVLALAGLVIQFWKGESSQIDLIAYLSPFILIVLPLMALVAAFAVLFEAIPFLQGGFGNIVYFISFVSVMTAMMVNLSGTRYAVLEPTGIGILENTMGRAVRAEYPDYDGGFSLGPAEEVTNTFTWNGVNWTSDMIWGRLSFFGLAVVLTLFAALFFDRFDPSRSKPRQKKAKAVSQDQQQTAAAGSIHAVALTPIQAAGRRFNFFNLLLAECRLLVKGQRWWWYAVAGGLMIACLVNPATSTRQYILPFAWVWPILVISGIGSREVHNNVQQLVFSSTAPLWRQLPAQWLAGFLLTVLVSLGALLRFAFDGDGSGLLALFSGAIFIPSLALAAGVWSGTSKLFEVVYMVVWYLGPLNRVEALDFSGAYSNGQPGFFIPFSIALLVLAVLGRARQLRN